MTGNGQGTQQGAPADAGAQVAQSISTLLAVVVVAFVAATPFTWALMVFLGNLGKTDIGFFGCLPGGVLIGVLVGATRSGK